MMKTLVVGATGATGKLVVEQLLIKGEHVKVIVRPTGNIPEIWNTNDNLKIIKANIAAVTVDDIKNYTSDCQAVVSCLGHNLTWKGIYGKPRYLVTDTIRLLCDAIKNNSPTIPVKVILMNTTGNRNRDLREPVSFGEKLVVGLVRFLLPPHVDNEKAADYLRTEIGQNHAAIEWVAVRPDTLINEENVTEYEVVPSPTRSAIFNAGKSSRINVAHFMTELITNPATWSKWKGQMPVLYNKTAGEP
jgi:hypothetical protein